MSPLAQHDEHLEEFKRKGYLILKHAVAEDEMLDMRDRLWGLLLKLGITRDPDSWPQGDVPHLQEIRQGDRDPLATPMLPEVLDAIFDSSEWVPKSNWGQALVTFPTPGVWRPIAGPWHLDHPYMADEQISGVNVFLFVEDVEAAGGGTLILESSPDVVAHFLRMHPEHKTLKLNKLIMASDPWLNSLTQKGPEAEELRQAFMNVEMEAFGQPIQLKELTGQAGDVAIYHPLMLHSPSINKNLQPRMMRVQRFYRQS